MDDPTKTNITIPEAIQLALKLPSYVAAEKAAAAKWTNGKDAVQAQAYYAAVFKAFLEAKAVIYATYDVAGSY